MGITGSAGTKSSGGGGLTSRAKEGRALVTGGWGLSDVLHPQASGLQTASAKGIAGAPSIGEQVQGLIEQAPAGFFNFGKGVLTDPVAAAGTGAIGGAAIAGPPGALVGGIGGAVVGGIGYGIRSIFDDGADPFETTKQLGESFQRTGSDILHPTHFARAAKRGEIISKLVEDIANASVVLGGAAKAVSAGTGGAAAKAVAAGQGVADAEAIAVKAAADAGRFKSLARAPGLSPALREAQLAKAAEAQGAADFASNFARTARAESAVLGEKAGGTLGLYKALKGASNLGNRGAMLPAQPYVLAGKALKKLGAGEYTAKAAEWAAGKFPAKTAAFIADSEAGQNIVGLIRQANDFVKSKAEAHAIKSDVSGQLHAGVIQARAEVGRVHRLHRELAKAVPDEIEQQAGNVLALGIPEALVRVGRDAADPAIIEDLIGSLTDHGEKPYTGITPEALQLAHDYQAGRIADPGVTARIGQAAQFSHEINQVILEPDFLRARGISEGVMAERGGEILADREWQVHGDEPNPVALERLRGEHVRATEAQLEQVDRARLVLEREVGKKLYEDNQTRAPKKAIKQDVDASTAAAQALIAGAPEITERLFPGLSGLDPNEQIRQVADAILQVRDIASTTPGIWDQMPEAFRAASDAQDWSGAKPMVGSLRGVSKLVAQGRHEGAAEALGAVGEKLRASAETARARGDKASAVAAEKSVERINGAVRRINKATNRVSKAAEGLKRAQAKVAKGAGAETDLAVATAERRLRNEISKTRSTVRRELMAASDELLYDVARTIGGWPDATLNVGRAGEDIARMVSDDLTSNLLKSPPASIRHFANGGRLSWDEVLYAWGEKRGHGDPTGNGMDMAAAAEELAGQINGAAQMRSAARGLVKNGFDAEDLTAVHNLESALAQLGYEQAEIAETMSMLTGRVHEAVAALSTEAKAPVTAFTPEMKARVNAAVEAQWDAEQQGVSTPGWAARTPQNPEGLTPFERSVADFVVAELKAGNAGRQLERVTAKQIDALIAPAVKAAQEQGRGVGLAQAADAVGKRAETATGAASRNAEARLSGGVADIGGPVAKAMHREGKIDRGVADAARRVGIEERVLERLTERQRAEVAQAEADIRNAPARYRPLIAFSRDAVARLEARRAQMNALVEGSGDYLDDVIAELPVTLSKAVEQGYNPEHRIGGEAAKVREPGRSTEGYIPQRRAGGETKEKVAMSKPANAAEETRFAAQRITDYVRNETVNTIHGRFGVGPSQVLGVHPEDAGIDISALDTPDPVARAAALEQVTAEASAKGLMILESKEGGVAFFPAELRSGERLIAAMADEGYVPWDPGQLFGKPTRENTNLGTSFIAKPVWDRFVKQVGPASPFETTIRNLYDKPMRLWKDQVLALSPRWQVNNIVGGVVTATAGGGINPTVYFKNMHKGLEMMRAYYDPAKLEALRAADPELAAIVDELSPELHQGSAAAKLEAGPRFSDKIEAPKKRGWVGGKYKGLTDASYKLNGFIDDANRLAVFLTERDRLTKAQLIAHLGKHKELRGVLAKGGEAALRDEVAIRLSLRTVGDFTRLTPFERDVVKRFLPFYPWMRHITKLALTMPVTAPMRVAWLMHMSALFGEPAEFPFMQQYIPVTGQEGDASRGYIHTGRINPFADVTYGSGGPSEFGLSNIPAQIASQLSPGIAEPIAQATGLDLRTWAQVSRPPGSGNFDSYGRGTFSPLIDTPSESLSHLSGLFPGARVARSAWDALHYGGKLPLRYANGQVIKSQGTTLTTDRPWYGPLTDFTGVPVSREKIDVTELRGKRDERLRRAMASRARYAGAGAASSGPVLPAWGAR